MPDSFLAPSVDLPIGQASNIFGVSLRALRFYEEVGLLRAGRRGRLKVRVYDAVARGRLVWISQLRKAGLRIPDIRLVLEAEDREGRGAECALELLERRRRRLLATLQDVRAARRWLAQARTPGGRSLP